jgi:UDP-N-acetylmuramyl tripeptide synthase
MPAATMALHRAQGSAWCSSRATRSWRPKATPKCASRWRTSAHAQRLDRLPGRERDGVDRRRLGAGHRLGGIRRALATFVNDAATAPGRFNVFDYKGATLIADYGHNPDAIQALCNAVETMPSKRRGGHQRRGRPARRGHPQADADPGRRFDEVVLYQDQCQRGREDGEVLALLRLQGAQRTSQVEEIRGEFVAIDTALSHLQPGDLCLILIDQVEEALDHIAKRVAGN